MLHQRTAREVFEIEYLPIRAKLLEIAAALDRIDRGEGSQSNDSRGAQIQAAIDVLRSAGDDRAERIQLIFSRQYDHDWKENFQMTNDE